jgi:hypothetical protein
MGPVGPQHELSDSRRTIGAMVLAHLLPKGGATPVPGFGTGAVLSVVLLGAAAFPLSAGHLAQFEALNRELGKLCGSNPPRQALTVCRLHAKLVRAF